MIDTIYVLLFTIVFLAWTFAFGFVIVNYKAVDTIVKTIACTVGAFYLVTYFL